MEFGKDVATEPGVGNVDGNVDGKDGNVEGNAPLHVLVEGIGGVDEELGECVRKGELEGSDTREP